MLDLELFDVKQFCYAHSMSPHPFRPPIGLQLSRTAHAATQAFERAMADAGGSASAWQVLLLVRTQQGDTQSAMAKTMGLTRATLTHHLNALERQGLVRRWREESNRRAQRVALTDAGEALFDRLRAVAARHDQRLRAQLTDEQVDQLGELLERLQAGLEEPAPAGVGENPH
jgi:MarR family transcriptional regulator, transcriptional regulator for hemolysin